MMESTELSIEIQEALRAVRDRLLQLRESYYFFMQAVHPDNPIIISWPDLLGKFNVIVTKHSHLRTEIKKYDSILNGLTLHPNEPPLNETELNSLSVLLRTKLLPSMERNELCIKESYQKEDLHLQIQKLEKLISKAMDAIENAYQNIDLRLRMEPLSTSTEQTDKLEKLFSWMSSGPLNK
jgi:hypothetical protein